MQPKQLLSEVTSGYSHFHMNFFGLFTGIKRSQTFIFLIIMKYYFDVLPMDLRLVVVVGRLGMPRPFFLPLYILRYTQMITVSIMYMSVSIGQVVAFPFKFGRAYYIPALKVVYNDHAVRFACPQLFSTVFLATTYLCHLIF